MFRIPSRKALEQELKCKVMLLVPGEHLELGYTDNTTGQDLMKDLVSKLDLLDKDYYGLKFRDQIPWLDLTKSIVKQTKGLSEVVFELRFKYYPAEPALLVNESTRYYLYLQLRLDLLEGRLLTESIDVTAYLIACILQSELGDYTYSPETENNYVSEFKFVPNQSEEVEWASIKLHQDEDFQGLGPSDSELNFLKKSCQLETYGIDPFPVKDGNSAQNFLIGVNHKGISTFHMSKRTNLFTWDEIERISCDNKLVLIYCRKIEKKGEKVSKSKSLFGFRCPSQAYAQNFWKIASEHRYFFTLESSPESPIVTNTGGLFKKNKLKYIGRVEKDLLRDRVDEVRSGCVKRSHSLMAKTNDGPLWQGFQQGTNMKSSLSNIYSSDFINKTLPADMNCFREEEEDELNEALASNGIDTRQENRIRQSQGSISRDPSKAFTRRSVLTTKTDALRRGSQVYMDTEQKTTDFIRATIFLVLLLAIALLVMLLINDSNRPGPVSLLITKMKLESVSNILRHNYYLPLKTAVRDGFRRIYSAMDSQLL